MSKSPSPVTAQRLQRTLEGTLFPRPMRLSSKVARRVSRRLRPNYSMQVYITHKYKMILMFAIGL
jgi:hypothetical protein